MVLKFGDNFLIINLISNVININNNKREKLLKSFEMNQSEVYI